MLSSRLDSWLAHRTRRRCASGVAPVITDYVSTAAGVVRVWDSGGAGPAVLMTPDGPNVVEHYENLLHRLTGSFRVVCFDMPGFGYSLPAPGYGHSLDQAARAVLDVIDHLRIGRACLAFSCANGFYALRAARLAPSRISRLVLSQTPSLRAMHEWTTRTVPAPLKVPVVGQWLGWALREKAALGWYPAALARNSPAAPFKDIARTALRCGACFSLAGVVQGLLKESDADLRGVEVPCTVVWGGQDRSHRHTDPESLRDVVPHAEFIQLPEVGHFPDLEAPRAFARILRTAMESGA